MTAMLEQLSSPRVLRGTKADIWVEVALDGVATDVDDASAPTVSVVDQDGTVVVASTAATIDTGRGRLALTLTAAQTSTVNQLTATWGNVILGGADPITLTSYHEVVGDHLFTVAQVRAFDSGTLGNDVTYPDEALMVARDRIADSFADILGYDVGLRARRETFDAWGGCLLSLGRARVSTIRSIATRSVTTWTAFTGDELGDVLFSPYGSLERASLGTWPVGNGVVRVTYEAGQQPINAELRLAALKLLRTQMVKSDLPARATSLTDQFGTFTLATPGQRGSNFGLPEVDEVLSRLADKAQKIGFA